MKAILIMDMPSSCSTCQLCVPSKEKHTGQFCWKCTIYPTMMIAKRKMNTRQEYCPLRECPTKKEIAFRDSSITRIEKIGYNDCIDEIGGGE